MTDIPADVLEAAHKALMSELFFLCQPNRGDVFSWMDDHPEALIPAIARAILADRAAQAERMARLEDAAKNAAMYLKTGFIECQRCGEEVATANTDAEYELRDALARALSQEGSDA